MSPTLMLYIILVQLESWTGHIEFLEERAQLEKGGRFEVGLWRLRSYNNLCDIAFADSVMNRTVKPPRYDAPIRFLRLRQGFYCFTATANSTPVAVSSVVSLNGQSPIDRCCSGLSLLWRADEDGVLATYVAVSNTSPSCTSFIVRVRAATDPKVCGDSDDGKIPPVVEYYVAKNSVVHVKHLNTSSRYCLSVSAGCRHCAELCPELVRKMVTFGNLEDRRDAADFLAMERLEDAIPVEDGRATLDPVIALLGFISIGFVITWALMMYQRLTNFPTLPRSQKYCAKKRHNFV